MVAGYGSPDLSGVTQTSGYYYICSAAGTAEPNGTGTEPDTWDTGDWVIYNDVSGTGQWQKIDNSSVLSGVGTGQTVALWEGAGSVTDSETLGNAPITVSGNNTTFAGTGNFGGSVNIASGGDLILTASSGSTDTGDIVFYHTAAEAHRLWSGVNTLNYRTDGGTTYQLLHSGNYTDYNTYTTLTATTQSAGDDTTNVATTEFVTDAVATGVGNYLPLSAGSGFPLTGDLIVSASGNTNLILQNPGGSGNSLLWWKDSSGGNDWYFGQTAENGNLNLYNYTSSLTQVQFKTNGVVDFGETIAVQGTGDSYFQGDVGIGTTSPEAKLHINGANLGSTNNDTTTQAIFSATNTNASKLYIQDYRTADGSDWTTSGKRIQEKIDSTWMGYIQFNGDSNNGGMSFGTGTNSTQGNVEERMRITSTGKVGIGTTSPDADFVVSHQGTSGIEIEANFQMGVNNILSFDRTVGALAYETMRLSANDYWFTTLGIERMRINSTGNVGIGTTSPSSKLHIKGSDPILLIQDDSTGTAQASSTLRLGESGAGGVLDVYWDIKQAADDLNTHLEINHSSNGNHLTILDNGNVGIGTTLPIGKFNVSKDSTTDGLSQAITVSSSSVNSKRMNLGYVPGSNYAFIDVINYAISNTNQALSLQPNGGNVGIGTTSPSHKLEVGLTSSVALASQPAIPLMISNNGNPVDGRVLLQVKHDTVNTAGAIAAGYQMTAAAVTSGTASYYDSLIFLESAGSNSETVHSAPKNIEFYVNNYNTAAGAGTSYTALGNLAFELQADGDAIFYDNVGIGTTSPSAKLEVNGQTVINSTGLTEGFQWFNDTNEIFSLEDTSGAGELLLLSSNSVKVKLNANGNSYFNGGNVGIGTTSPSAKLDIYGDSNSSDNMLELSNSKYDSTDTTGETGILFGWNNHVAARIAAFKEGTINRTGFKIIGEAGFNTPTTIATFRSTGNVGIGTTSPSAKLQVAGTTTYNSDSTQTLRVCDAADVSKGIHIGYDTTVDAGIIQAGDFGVSYRNLALNPNAGNVGIGTTSPSSKLHVAGNSTFIGGNEVTTNLYIHATNTAGAPARTACINMKGYEGRAIGTFFKDSSFDPDSSGVASEWFAGLNYAGNFTKYSIGFDGTDGTPVPELLSAAKLTVTNLGNVGIGTSDPDSKLEVIGNGGTVLDIQGTQGQLFSVTDDLSGDIFSVADISGVPIMSVNSDGTSYFDGRLRIEGPAPIATQPMLELHRTSPVVDYKDLNYAGYFSLKERFLNSGSTVIGSREVSQNPGGSGIYHNFDNGASGGSQFHQKQNSFHWKINSTSEKLTLGTNGYLGINDTSPSYQLDVNGSGRFTSTVTATNFINSSDERLKENIEELGNNNVEVNWKTFNFKTEKEQKRYGVIAQELEKTNPEFVREDSKGFKSVAYIDLLIAKIAELEARIQKLEK